jgi:Txe/YoeB family toxin of Txe-Axe toxin-antitoxin module
MNLYEMADYLKRLSDITDLIKKLDRDTYKHYSDMEILEMVLNEKIEQLRKG